MKKYNVNVNGNLYEITLEVVDEKEATASAKKPSASAASAPASGSEAIKAPMPGNILAVNVKEGATVKKGDVLMILEAMKMENEIMAPKAGKITSVNVSKGSTVESGTLLCTIA